MAPNVVSGGGGTSEAQLHRCADDIIRLLGNNNQGYPGNQQMSYMEDHMKNKDRLEKEWEALCAYQAEPNASTVGTKDGNARKNRSAAAVAYDHSRITLKVENSQSNSDYINASPIMDHDPRNPAYIATQGPLPSTVADFWQMVWENGCVVIVMLTPLAEGGVKQCYHYWPDEGSNLYHIYEVNLVSEHIWCDDFLVRSFYLKNMQTNETRTVTQFHFLTWLNQNVPESSRTLLDFRRYGSPHHVWLSCRCLNVLSGLEEGDKAPRPRRRQSWNNVKEQTLNWAGGSSLLPADVSSSCNLSGSSPVSHQHSRRQEEKQGDRFRSHLSLFFSLCPCLHRSDGAGRTGTYILIDMVLNKMAKGGKEIDIAATLEHLRDQRPGMVQTKDQFEFALTAVAEEVNAILKALPQSELVTHQPDVTLQQESKSKPPSLMAEPQQAAGGSVCLDELSG
ncbi:Receptor-type tyrosine-protein phosphatase N2 [Takifugu flavidus]|uniref:Receptor-type tyrosine-protein phosphatase N2 n=1 Tax=Takifugu flavidus TaxID=433684 RepID=A0A5C6P1N8_9TELE|nr:Receptor-type tyrosine-protein phosphatase N2 [Takifugu flavidus]